MMAFEPVFPHHLKAWGSMMNDGVVLAELGLGYSDGKPPSPLNLWFDTQDERQEMKEAIKAACEKHNRICALGESSGHEAQVRTVAYMDFVLPDGRVFPYSKDFGYGYNAESAHFMFHDGNYSCDCNKSLFLDRVYGGFDEMDCGDTIQIRNFRVVEEP